MPKNEISEYRKTLFMVIPYGIGWSTILNEKGIEYFNSRKIRLVIIAESPLISISNPLVHTEKLLPYNRSKFEIILGILRNFVFVDTSKKHRETLELKIKIYEQHRTMVRWMRKLFGKRLSKSKSVKSLLTWLDLNAFGDKSYENLFDKYKPNAVFITYPFSYYVYPIQRMATKQKIPTIAYVPSWDNLTSKWEVPAKYNQMIVWNQIMKNEAVELLDYDPENVKVSGVPQWDLYADPNIIIPKKAFMETIGADPSKKLLTYATGTPALYKDEAEIVEVIYEAMMGGSFSKPSQLLVRLHPRRDVKDFMRFEGKKDLMIQTPGKASNDFARAGYFWVSDISDYRILANTIAHSDVVISVASTVTIESCILNRPVVNIGFDGKKQRPYYESVRRYFDYTHYRPILKAGGVRVANSKEELVQIINAYLQDETIDAKGRKKIVKEQCYKVDGKSLERLLELVLDFMNENEKPLIAESNG